MTPTSDPVLVLTGWDSARNNYWWITPVGGLVRNAGSHAEILEHFAVLGMPVRLQVSSSDRP